MAASGAPPSVRAIHRARDLVHQRFPAILVAGAALAVLGLAGAGVYTVENGQTAAVLRFGELVDSAVEPGLRLSFPGVHEVLPARTADVFRVAIEGDFAPELALVTGDENLIETELVVQYRIKDLSEYLFAGEDPEGLLQQVVRAALVEAFAATPVDEVLTSGKARIQNQVRRAAQGSLDRCGAGIALVSVNLQSVDPPREAAGAFRAVSDARAEAAQSINRAQGEKDRALRLARGEADKLRTEAGAAADRRVQEARGSAERFEALLRQKRLAPGQTRAELYTATLRKVLPAARLIVLAPGEAPKIDVHTFDRGEGRGRIPPGVSFDDR